MTAVLEHRADDLARAARLVADRSDCTRAEALAMIEARAIIFDQPVEQIVTAVVERGMRFRYGAPSCQATTTRLRPITFAR